MKNLLNDRIKLNLFYPNYYSFFVNGAMVLLVGAILPYLIEEAHINYSTAGTFLSSFAVGNFLASFINPALSKAIGRKPSIVLTSLFMPLSLFGITLIPPIPVMIILFVFLGISRGCYSIINNAYINENSDGSPVALNILHGIFASGAFAAPMIMTVLFKFNFSWRAVVYTIMSASVVSIILIAQLKLHGKKSKASGETVSDNDSKNVSLPQDSSKKNLFFRQPVFWISGFILFFYLGLENCVNGWFVTYFKSTGIISQSYANSLVSITWLAVMFGRLLTALISSKVKKEYIILTDCIATSLFFILLISSKSLPLITVSIVGLGFFFAGIYATSVANARSAIYGSDLGTSMLLGISALGGIITPQIVGSVADKIGLVGAIGTLLINSAGMIILSSVNAFSKKIRK